MEQKQSSCGGSVYDHLLPLYAKYPWVVAQNLGAEEDSSGDGYFFTLHDPLTNNYRCQIPELLGRRIRGYYHGWVILSDHLQNVMWSLWNPATSKMIHFPPLILKDGDSDSILECCLSAQPDDPSSVLLLTRTSKPTFVFIRLKGKRKKLRWIEMSYASQLKRITSKDGFFIHSLTCCNGKVYAVNGEGCHNSLIIQLDVLVKVKEVLIKLLALVANPRMCVCSTDITLLKGYGTELFCIVASFHEKTLNSVCLYKLDMTSLNSEDMERFKGFDMRCRSLKNLVDILKSKRLWVKLVDLKDAIFFVDLARDNVAYYRPGIASELGGYVHIRDTTNNVLYSYHVKDNTISLSSMPSLVLPTSNVSVWEHGLENNHGGAMGIVDSKQDNQMQVRSITHNELGVDEWNLLNLPFDILELIMEHCVCVEYLNFRATCKHFHLAAPLIQWSNKISSRRLQTCSLVSPLLLVIEKNKGVITFTDPLLGDNYFMKRHVWLPENKISCSRFGWLLFFSRCFQCSVFFNPFTSDFRKLPQTAHTFQNMYFSAPPTSPDCMVIGYSPSEKLFSIHYVAREPTRRTIRVGGELSSIHFPTFIGQDLYVLDGDGKLIGFKELGEEDCISPFVEASAPISHCTPPLQYYLMECNQNLLKVIVGKFGECVEVFKWDISKQEWEKIDSLGNHMIYICDTTCLCIEAKTREMENKIYFPILHSKNRKIVYYSLETCTYGTFNGENNQQDLKDFFGTTHHWFPHVWIEPSWS